jgi:hypothetical protein
MGNLLYFLIRKTVFYSRGLPSPLFRREIRQAKFVPGGEGPFLHADEGLSLSFL